MMRRLILVCFCLTLLILISVDSKDEKIVHCELEALKMGTRLADIYNGPFEDTVTRTYIPHLTQLNPELHPKEWDMRVHQEQLMEHLGFAPWMADGTWKSGE